MATYNEGGRGRKQCPACKKYVGFRSATCECGHVFAAKEESIPAPQPVRSTQRTFTEMGPGRKKCPRCNLILAIGTRVCEACFYSFKNEQPQPVQASVMAPAATQSHVSPLKPTVTPSPVISAPTAAPTISTQKTYTEGGRGRKRCNCGLFLPATVKSCLACGYSFVKPIVKQADTTTSVTKEAPTKPSLVSISSMEKVVAPPVVAPKPVALPPVPRPIVRKVVAPKPIPPKPPFVPFKGVLRPILPLPRDVGDWFVNQEQGIGDDGTHLGFEVVVGPPVATPTWTVPELIQMGLIGLYFKRKAAG